MRRAAFSLFEVLVAGALLLVVGLAVIGALSQFTREAKTTSDYSLSLFLSQKVVEEVIQSTYENPHAAATIAALDGTRMDVEDPFNPYFATVEDTAAPYGRMEIGTDLGVDTRAPVLHRLYRDYDLTLATAGVTVPELTGSPQLLERLEIIYEWPGLKAEPRVSNFPVLISRPVVSPVATPPIAQDLPGMDVEIRRALYAGVPGSDDLATVVSRVGAQVAAVRDLGSIVVVSSLASTQESQSQAAITTMEAQLAAGPDDPDLRVAVARLYERRAAAAWQALLYCRDPARRLSTSFAAADVGGRGRVDGAFVFTAISRAIRLRATFDYDSGRALDHCLAARRLLAPLAARPYWQYTLERKILELAKLRALSTESPDISFVNQWIDAMTAIYAGRNRAVAEFLAREQQSCTSLAGIQALLPAIRDRVTDMNSAGTALMQLQARTGTELF